MIHKLNGMGKSWLVIRIFPSSLAPCPPPSLCHGDLQFSSLTGLSFTIVSHLKDVILMCHRAWHIKINELSFISLGDRKKNGTSNSEKEKQGSH